MTHSFCNVPFENVNYFVTENNMLHIHSIQTDQMMILVIFLFSLLRWSHKGCCSTYHLMKFNGKFEEKLRKR